MDELTPPAAASFIRAQAQSLNLVDLVQASGETIDQIYAVTGGNPLAIELVVGLTAVHPLPQMLADLLSANIGEIGQLYCHIGYHRTSQPLAAGSARRSPGTTLWYPPPDGILFTYRNYSLTQDAFPAALTCFAETRQLAGQFPDDAWAINPIAEYTAK